MKLSKLISGLQVPCRIRVIDKINNYNFIDIYTPDFIINIDIEVFDISMQFPVYDAVYRNKKNKMIIKCFTFDNLCDAIGYCKSD